MNGFWVVCDENELCDSKRREDARFYGRETIWRVYNSMSIEDDEMAVRGSGLVEPFHK